MLIKCGKTSFEKKFMNFTILIILPASNFPHLNFNYGAWEFVQLRNTWFLFAIDENMFDLHGSENEFHVRGSLLSICIFE